MVQAVFTARQRWAHLALGMQQDAKSYTQLQQLLKTQFHVALRHDAQEMQRVAGQIESLAHKLEHAAQQRVAHASALLPEGAEVSMGALFGQLKAPLKDQLQALWDQLQTQVEECKAMNMRNCALIMQQAEVMRQVIAGGSMQEGIYGPC